MTELELPKIGLGTWKLKPSAAKFSTIEAIKLGYRFIDTAQAYGNENGVGEGLKEIFDSGILKRKEVVIATKLHPLKLRPGFVHRSTLKSLKKLQLDYVDILYVHYPAFALGYSHSKTLNAISHLIDEGKVMHVGVSNFTQQLIEEALEVCDKPIFANQIEHHPYLQQKSMHEFLMAKKINMVSYSPLGQGHVLTNPVLVDIAKRNNISVAQLCLVWLISKGAIPIPKATSYGHLKENYESCSKEISKEDIQKIEDFNFEERYVHPIVVAPKEWSKRN
ncbi:MAG: aldo/keto reductase [Candidatus Heimdallarchaeota archaeon]|nr:aldo/keto reductase [Candidatus Heimdallarchaeota archaeon]MCK4955958.1 aldo/keto reductase [Candidatus Heimdallarchaeota archaeon]